ncbi:hypothetical protein CMV_001549 [Castanea mollissima]|uniref:Uncharacterized protein n=1 Tax=Castanea mollissima TaxID=60419 RepID=A0A8J4RRD0_9ROSI|nr:hypothetical protein CMV_001549 [Castanea mollissima]
MMIATPTIAAISMLPLRKVNNQVLLSDANPNPVQTWMEGEDVIVAARTSSRTAMSNFLALAVAMAGSSAQSCEFNHSVVSVLSSKDSRDATHSNGTTMLHSLGVRFRIHCLGGNYSVKDNIAALKLAKMCGDIFRAHLL